MTRYICDFIFGRFWCKCNNMRDSESKIRAERVRRLPFAWRYQHPKKVDCV
jgi:hypothetical protein